MACLGAIAVVAIIAIIAIIQYVQSPGVRFPKALSQFEQQIQQELAEQDFTPPDNSYIVFITASDMTDRPIVKHAAGSDFAAAFSAACSAVGNELQTDPAYVKCDIVASTETIELQDLQTALINTEQNRYNYGLALDPNFNKALLASTLQTCGAYPESYSPITLDSLNQCLELAGMNTIDKLPAALQQFQTKSWIYDTTNNTVMQANTACDSKTRIAEIINSNIDYLRNDLSKRNNGRFTYAQYPTLGYTDGHYNIVRHAVTILSLINSYHMNRVQAGFYTAPRAASATVFFNFTKTIFKNSHK